MNAFQLAVNLSKMGVAEQAGDQDDAFIRFCLGRVGLPNAHDETAWCSAFATTVHEMLGLKTSTAITLPSGHVVHRAAARSWLRFGVDLPRAEWRPGDVCVFKRGTGHQPGREVLDAQGHVAFFSRLIDGQSDGTGPMVEVCGGNQANKITIASFPLVQLLAVRRAV